MRWFASLLCSFMPLVFICLPSWAINIGDPFPGFSQTNVLTQEDCAYLQIGCTGSFNLRDVPHDVVIIEFLNVYCHTCRTQVAIFNDLYAAIQQEPSLRGRVCILGIAVGNSADEVRTFRKDFGALYPILTDRDKKIFKMTGNIQGTPHTYILRKEDQRFIIDYHAGGVASKDRYLSTVTFALRGSFTGTEPGNRAPAYAFTAAGRLLSDQDLAGKRAILFFPADKRYPLAMDTRNIENQAEVFDGIKKKYPDVTIILVRSPGLVLPQGFQLASGLIAEARDPKLLDTLRAPDAPVVYFINQYGRIAFRGEAITLENAQTIIDGKEYRPALDLPEKKIIGLIEERIRTTGRTALETEKVVLDNRQSLYVTTLSPKRDGVFLLARLESRPTLCNVCHDTHFIYILDQAARIVDFIPISITKYGNEPWSEQDAQKLRRALVGRSIFDDFSFNPQVDAVSSATMSSSLIYEALGQAKELLGEFTDYNFRREHWQAVCFNNMCAIQKALKQRGPDAPVDTEAVNSVMSADKLPGCPLHGMYVVVDGAILCSIHGLNMQGCSP